MRRESLPDPLRTWDGRLVATRAELDAAVTEVFHGSSGAGRFSMLWGLDSKTVVPPEWLPRLASEARDLLGDVEFVGFLLSEGTRAMLERIGALATEEAFQAEQAAMEAAMRAEAMTATTEPMVVVVEFDDPGSLH